ncbi:MAG: S1C family serine protease [Butyrivibrio sp.]|nr:S1C family serine protease [Butyrivibrio sp.]
MDENNGDKKYDLYTEHIVPEHGRKIKRLLKKMLLVLAMAVFFGLVAGLVMIIVYRAGSRFFPEQETKREVTLAQATTAETKPEETPEATTEHETVTLPSATQTSAAKPEETTTAGEGETIPGVDEIERIHEAYKAVAAKINGASVTVAVFEDGVDWFDTVYQNVSYEYGLIVARDSGYCYILTDYSVLADKTEISVTYSDGSVRNAEPIMGDSSIGMAVIRAQLAENENIRPAVLGNSDLLSQGDALIAVGKIYGYTGTVGYGTAAGGDKILANTDSEFNIINTDIASDAGATGALCNLDGEVVGIITPAYVGSGSFVNAYAISGVHMQIERLINAKQRAYLGIKGQSVTAQIQALHQIPEGIYLSAVEVNSPAHNSGIQTGDVITAVGRESVTDMNQFMNALSEYAPGDNIEITVKRRGRDSYKEIVFRVTLGVQ